MMSTWRRCAFFPTKIGSAINVTVEFGEGEEKVLLDHFFKKAPAYKPKEQVRYKIMQEYTEAKYSFKVHTAYIAEVKKSRGYQCMMNLMW